MNEPSLPDDILLPVEWELAGQELETVVVFDQNGREVFRRSGTRDEVLFHDVDLTSLAGCTVTHNHPEGTSLSISDVRLAIEARLREMRVVTREGRYILRIGYEVEWEDLVDFIDDQRRLLMRMRLSEVNLGVLAPEENQRGFNHALWEEVADIRQWDYGFKPWQSS